MTAAIFFDTDAYSVAGPKLMGRNAAGEGFLRGYLTYAETDRFWVQPTNQASLDAFVAATRAMGRVEPIEVVASDAHHRLAAPGTLYFPGPNFAGLLRTRSFIGDSGWSVCGVTHTTASETAMDGIAEMLVAPAQPWDAIICTSAAVHANVEILLERQREFLRERLGATRFPAPQLPIIPLGVHTADFARSDADRAAARDAMAIEEGTIVVLYVGRLSFHAKAHPAAMYRALETARAQTPGARIVLIECGWFAHPQHEESFDAAHAALAPSIGLMRVDGRDPVQRRRAWAAADVFCSLADNVQETFGLTPVEAMAAGLPVVVSDWDGYRDTVRDGIDGFRIATRMAPPGTGGDLAWRHALGIDSYDRYCGYSAAFVEVDIAEATAAFAALFASPERRRAMGAAGQARALAAYDWREVIPRYEALWRELAARRAAAGGTPRPRDPWPARTDPYTLFAGYPTALLAPASIVALAWATLDEALAHLDRMRALRMVDFVRDVVPDREGCAALLTALAGGPVRADAAVATFAPARQGVMFRTLVWLAKIGVVRIGEG